MTKAIKLPDLEYLKERIEYDEEKGKLYWKPRTMQDFATERAMNAWNKRFVGKELGSINHGYRRVKLLDNLYFVHRIIWLMHHGKEPEFGIDHLNGDTDDNRIVNMRDTGQAQNNKNARKRKDNPSGVTGVRQVKSGRYAARIRVKGKEIALGTYDTLEEAKQARLDAQASHGFHNRHGV